jgi:hypothetical protein
VTCVIGSSRFEMIKVSSHTKEYARYEVQAPHYYSSDRKSSKYVAVGLVCYRYARGRSYGDPTQTIGRIGGGIRRSGPSTL